MQSSFPCLCSKIIFIFFKFSFKKVLGDMQADYCSSRYKISHSFFWDKPGYDMYWGCFTYGYSCCFSEATACFFPWTSQYDWWLSHFCQSSWEVSPQCYKFNDRWSDELWHWSDNQLWFIAQSGISFPIRIMSPTLCWTCLLEIGFIINR